MIDADRIGREVVESDIRLRRRLAEAFGGDILTPTGRLRRRLVAERAFASETQRRRLNRIVHPALLKELHRRVTAQLKARRIVVIDAALLLEWKLDREVDLSLAIHASETLRLNRMKARGIAPADFAARQKRQIGFRAMSRRVDHVIHNNKDRKYLAARLKELLESEGVEFG